MVGGKILSSQIFHANFRLTKLAEHIRSNQSLPNLLSQLSILFADSSSIDLALGGSKRVPCFAVFSTVTFVSHSYECGY